MGDVYPDKMQEAFAKLPVGIVDRLLGDTWSFGLMLNSGTTVIIDQLEDIVQAADGSLWLEVTLATEAPWTIRKLNKAFLAPTDRKRAAIALASVAAIFEASDS